MSWVMQFTTFSGLNEIEREAEGDSLLAARFGR